MTPDVILSRVSLRVEKEKGLLAESRVDKEMAHQMARCPPLEKF